MNIHFPCSIFHSRSLTRREKCSPPSGETSPGDWCEPVQRDQWRWRSWWPAHFTCHGLLRKWPVMGKSHLKYVEICWNMACSLLNIVTYSIIWRIVTYRVSIWFPVNFPEINSGKLRKNGACIPTSKSSVVLMASCHAPALMVGRNPSGKNRHGITWEPLKSSEVCASQVLHDWITGLTTEKALHT